jgi:hypothetical protein
MTPVLAASRLGDVLASPGMSSTAFAEQKAAAGSAKAMKCKEQTPVIKTLHADLAGDGKPFTISFGLCDGGDDDNDGYITIARVGDSQPTSCYIGIPSTNFLYYMRVEKTASHSDALRIKANHRNDDTINSIIRVNGGRFVVSKAKPSPSLWNLDCEKN